MFGSAAVYMFMVSRGRKKADSYVPKYQPIMCIPRRLKNKVTLYKVYHTRCLNIEYSNCLVYARVKDGSHKSPYTVDLLSGVVARGKIL